MENFIFRKTNKNDVLEVNEIFTQAKNFIKNLGIDQWQADDDYPNVNSILVDIDKNISYVAVLGDEIVGTIVISFDYEEPYSNIQGKKLCNIDSYAVIHRFAIKNEHRGSNLAHFLLENIENICNNNYVKSICIDTHKGNIVMQKFALKNGFEFCGEINILCGGETLRYVYEKCLVY